MFCISSETPTKEILTYFFFVFSIGCPNDHPYAIGNVSNELTRCGGFFFFHINNFYAGTKAVCVRNKVCNFWGVNVKIYILMMNYFKSGRTLFNICYFFSSIFQFTM